MVNQRDINQSLAKVIMHLEAAEQCLQGGSDHQLERVKDANNHLLKASNILSVLQIDLEEKS